jgi:hypothetical protein
VPSTSFCVGVLAAAEAGGLDRLTSAQFSRRGAMPNAAVLLVAAWLKRRAEMGESSFSAVVETGGG